jgi:hypothetical protein
MMIDILNPMIKKFLPFAQEKMGFDKPPKLFLKGDNNNASDPLGKTAFYNPDNESITIYITDRHPKDVMRSLSHELVHHTQNCNGQFDDVGEMGEGYAQNNEHLREMEREAYEVGNMCFRDWEDSIKSTIYFEHLQKGEKKMSIKDWKNKEIGALISEAWGFGFNVKNLNEEGKGWGKDPAAFTGTKKSEDEEAEELKTGGPLEEEESEEGSKWKGGEHEYKRRGKKGKVGKRAGDVGGHYKTGETTESALKEDSGEEEGEHYEDDTMHDADHIKAIEHHLDALKHDKDYDEEHIDERRGRGRQDPRTQRGEKDPRQRPMEEGEDDIEEVVGSVAKTSGPESRRRPRLTTDKRTRVPEDEEESAEKAEKEKKVAENMSGYTRAQVREALKRTISMLKEQGKI